MIKRLALIILLIATASGFSAQGATTLDFATVDRLTYNCYNQQKWDSVILVGKQALRQDIDYYYLRVRMGISYFEKQQYYQSSAHLEMARKFNSGDPYVADYLYRAYLFTNREDEAHRLRSSLPREDQEIPGILKEAGDGFLKSVHFESGYTLSSDARPDNLSTLIGHDSVYGEQDLYGNNIYENLGLQLRIAKGFSVTLAYNYLNFQKTKYIQYGMGEAQRDTIIENGASRDYYYSFPFKIHDTSFRYNVHQHEAYLSATVSLPWGIKLIPAFHWIHAGYTKVSADTGMVTKSDTAYYSYIDNTYHTFTYRQLAYNFSQTDTSFNNYLASLRISKDWGIFNIALTGSWSKLNGKQQKQIGVSLTYYPLGNLNLYGTTTVTGFFQGKSNRLLLSQVVGARITPWMWAEGNFYYGDYTNSNIFNGAIVYNNSDKIDYRAGATLLFLVGKHIQLSLIYQYFRKESLQTNYIKVEDPSSHNIKETPQTIYNPYNTNSIIGGITWKL